MCLKEVVHAMMLQQLLWLYRTGTRVPRNELGRDQIWLHSVNRPSRWHSHPPLGQNIHWIQIWRLWFSWFSWFSWLSWLSWFSWVSWFLWVSCTWFCPVSWIFLMFLIFLAALVQGFAPHMVPHTVRSSQVVVHLQIFSSKVLVWWDKWTGTFLYVRVLWKTVFDQEHSLFWCTYLDTPNAFLCCRGFVGELWSIQHTTYPPTIVNTTTLTTEPSRRTATFYLAGINGSLVPELEVVNRWANNFLTLHVPAK